MSLKRLEQLKLMQTIFDKVAPQLNSPVTEIPTEDMIWLIEWTQRYAKVMQQELKAYHAKKNKGNVND